MADGGAYGVPFVEEVLSNGLRAVVAPRPGVPVVTVAVTYDVGSRVEPPGKTGLAHLFEHLMFEGTPRVPKGEHFAVVTGAGGVLNGTTSEDRTNYFETLPSEALDIALFLESDRMHDLALHQETFATQREAVKEEKRLRIDNQPYAPSFLLVDELAYESFAYRHPVIGSMEDLDAATLDDARAFYEHHYAPGNALVCVAGDVGAEEGLAAVRRRFGPLPARSVPPPFACDEPVDGVAREADVTDPHAVMAGLHVVWKAPPRRHLDILALAYVEKALTGGESSRLYRRLVRDGASALSLSASVDEKRGPSLFRTFAVARPGIPLEAIERELDAELARLAGEGPTAAEMERARRMLAADALRALQTSQGLAFILTEYGLYDGAPRLFLEDVERLLAVTREEVRDVAARTFVPARRTTVRVRPVNGSSPDAARGPA